MSEVNPVELASVRLALAAALETKGPGYVYEMPTFIDGFGETQEFSACVYVEPVEETGGLVASCLWGHVLVTLGCDPGELDRHEGGTIDMLPVPWTDPVITAAAKESQWVQDRGDPWDQAVEEFERYVKDGPLPDVPGINAAGPAGGS